MDKAAHTTTNEVSTQTAEGLRILFADDDDAMGWLVKRYLEKAGHEVHVVQGGQEALNAAQLERFDVVLLDLLMPTMDGVETAEKLRAYAEANGQDFPIIAATSHRVETLEQWWDGPVFDAVLTKPVKGEDLSRAMSELPC